MGDLTTLEGLSQGVKDGFGIEARRIELIRHNENITCRVFADCGEYALRVRKPADGFSTDCIRQGVSALSFVQREADLLAYLHDNGMNVQRPVMAVKGGYIHRIGGTLATLYKWITGDTIEKAVRTRELGERIGRMTAQMHRLLKAYDDGSPAGGYQYTQRLLPVLSARVNGAHEAGVLTAEQENTLLRTLDTIGRRMDELDARYGAPQSVHADLSPGNMLLTANGIAPIDFSLSGASYIHMDIAGLFANISEPEVRMGILEGYARESGAEIELPDAEPYFALQIMLFIACQYERFMTQDWFKNALERWIKQTFAPLVRSERFLRVE